MKKGRSIQQLIKEARAYLAWEDENHIKRCPKCGAHMSYMFDTEEYLCAWCDPEPDDGIYSSEDDDDFEEEYYDPEYDE